MFSRRTHIAIGVIAALAFTLSACGSDDTGDGDSGSDQTLTVLAASSLTESFTAIADEFEQSHDNVEVSLSFESSSTLATQVIEGAPADVLATASPGSMQPVVDAGDTDGDPQTFATNTVAIALPKGNPAGIKDIADLQSADVKVAICVDSAPCGSVAADFFNLANLDVTPVTEEVDVKSVLAKVVTDEVDAGIVYNSDIVASGDTIESIPIPTKLLVSTDYLISPLTSSENSDLAQEFVDAVLSPSGQQTLADAGFDTE